MPIPINNNLLSAINISDASGSINGTLVDATLEASEQALWWGGDPGRNVWYKYTPPVGSSLYLTFTIQGSGFNPNGYIFSGQVGTPNFADFDTNGEIDFNGNGTPGLSSTTQTIRVHDGYCVYIMVTNWEFDLSEGTFTLSWTSTVPTDHDELLGAIELPLGESRHQIDLSDYTQEPDEFGSECNAWYKVKNDTAQDRFIWIERIRLMEPQGPNHDRYNHASWHFKINFYTDNGFNPKGVGYDDDSLLPIGIQFGYDEYAYWQNLNEYSSCNYIIVPANSTIWIEIIDDQDIPTAIKGTFRFYCAYGDRYVVQAADDFNDTATTSIVSGKVRETQQVVYDYTKPNSVAVWDTETFYVRGSALPPPGKYMIRIRHNFVSGNPWDEVFITIRRGGRVVGQPCYYDGNSDALTSGAIQIHHPLTNFTYHNPAYWTGGSYGIDGDYARALPFLYVTSDDLSIAVSSDSNITPYVDVDYIEFTRIGDLSDDVGTFNLLERETTLEGLGNKNLTRHDHDAFPTQYSPPMTKICITDDGTLWAITADNSKESGVYGWGPTRYWGPYLHRWNGTSWTEITGGTELRYYSQADYLAAGAPDQKDKLDSIVIATDGINLWLAWVEPVPGSALPAGKIVVKKYDVATNTFSLVGTPISDPTNTMFMYNWNGGMLDLGVSRYDGADPSRPYVASMTQTTLYVNRRSELYVFKLAGGVWVDTNKPGPGFTYLADGWYEDAYPGPFMYMLHHDGPSDYPCVMVMRNTSEYQGPGVSEENSTYEYMYSEYNGSSWVNTIYFNPVDVMGGQSLTMDEEPDRVFTGSDVFPYGQHMGWDGSNLLYCATFFETFRENAYFGYYMSDNNTEQRRSNPTCVLTLKSDGSEFEYLDRGSVSDISGALDNQGPRILVNTEGEKFVLTSQSDNLYIVRYTPCMETKWTLADNDTPNLPGFYGNIFTNLEVAQDGDVFYVCLQIYGEYLTSNYGATRVYKYSPSVDYDCPTSPPKRTVSINFQSFGG